MFLLALFVLALVGATVTLLAWASVLPRVRADHRLGQITAYGGAVASAGPEAAPGSSHVMLEGVASRLGSLVARLVGAREDDLRQHLMAAGIYRLGPTALLGYRALATILMPVLVLLAAPATWSPLMTIAVVAIAAWSGWALPLVLLKRKARKRLYDIDYALPGMIDLLVVTVEAGLGFSGAMQLAAEKLHGPLGDELRLTMQEQRMGLGVTDALKNMAARADTTGMRTFARAIVQGEQLGVSIGHILRAVAVDMRKLRRAMAEERAQKAPVKMLFPLVFLIFPALFILLLGPAALEIVQILGDVGSQ
jgi:tight adherence protein C